MKFMYMKLVLCMMVFLTAMGSMSDIMGQVSDQIIVSGHGDIGGRPAIAHDGQNFFTVWGKGDVFGARISENGLLLDTSAIAIANGSRAVPSVAFDGENFLVVWVGLDRSTHKHEVFGARVSTNGIVIDDPVLQLTQGGNPKDRPISLAYDGDQYMVVWRTGRDHIRGIRISPEGYILDESAEGFALTTKSGNFYPWISAGDSIFMVVWHRINSIYGARVDQSGDVHDVNGFIISQSSSMQNHASIAYDGQHFLVVWHDYRNMDQYNNGTAYGARLSENGTVLDEPAFRIAAHAFWQAPVQVVFDGSAYFVVWHEHLPANFRLSNVYGRRVSTSGTLFDEPPVPVTTSHGHHFGPVLGFGNGRYLVAWNESHTSRCYGGCIGSRLVMQTDKQGNETSATANTASSTPTELTGNWHTHQTLTESRIQGIWGSRREGQVFGVTSLGNIVGWDGDHWAYAHALRGSARFDIWGTGSTDVWATGWCWDILRYDGISHYKTDCTSNNIGMGIWGGDSLRLVTVGTAGRVVHYEGTNPRDEHNDRNNWHEKESGVGHDLWDVWGMSPTNAYAIGEHGTVLHYDGNTWKQETGVPTKQSLNAIWGSNANDIFVVGDNGTIVHFDGDTWTLHDSNTTEHLFGVAGFGKANVYAVGHYGTIRHYNGHQWHGIQTNVHTHFNAAWAGVNDLWIACDKGMVLEKTDPSIQSALLSVMANPLTGGFVEGAGIYEYGEEAGLLAIPEQEYQFVSWTEDGEEVHDQPAYVFSVSSDRSLVANFQSVVAAHEMTGGTSIRVFPVPANHTLQVHSSSIMQNARLFDITGRQLRYVAIDDTAITIDVSDLQAGIYFLQVMAQGRPSVHRVVKNTGHF